MLKIRNLTNTPSGMSKTIFEKTFIFDGEHTIKTIVSKFSKKHHMYRNYGVTELKVEQYPNNSKFYTLQADFFKDKKVEFTANNSNLTRSGGNTEVADFLKKLKIFKNLEQIPFLEEVLGIAKFLK